MMTEREGEMMRLIRVSWDRDLGTFMVETGKEGRRDLSEEEKAELEGLKNQLEPYGDFLNVGDLEEKEREKVFETKARRAELEGSTEIIWTPKAKNEVESVVLVIWPDKRPIYVENLPSEWIEKLFKSEVIIENPQVILGRGPPPEAREETRVEEETRVDIAAVPGSDRLNRVRKCLYALKGKPDFRGAETYLDCVDVVDEDNYVKVTPKRWLEEDWRPINDGLETAFGKQGIRWTTEGKTSHWRVL